MPMGHPPDGSPRVEFHSSYEIVFPFPEQSRPFHIEESAHLQHPFWHVYFPFPAFEQSPPVPHTGDHLSHFGLIIGNPHTPLSAFHVIPMPHHPDGSPRVVSHFLVVLFHVVPEGHPTHCPAEFLFWKLNGHAPDPLDPPPAVHDVILPVAWSFDTVTVSPGLRP